MSEPEDPGCSEPIALQNQDGDGIDDDPGECGEMTLSWGKSS